MSLNGKLFPALLPESVLELLLKFGNPYESPAKEQIAWCRELLSSRKVDITVTEEKLERVFERLSLDSSSRFF